MTTIQLFRAVSGSQYVYFRSDETVPSGISDRVVINNNLEVNIDTSAFLTGSNVLWEWNGVDTSQFITSSVDGATSHNGSISLTTTSSNTFTGTTVLKMDFSGYSGDTYFVISQSFPRRFVFRARLIEQNGGGTADDQFAVLFLYNNGVSSSMYGLEFKKPSTSTNINIDTIESGSAAIGHTLTGASIDFTPPTSNGGIIEWTIDAETITPSSVPFTFTSNVTEWADGATDFNGDFMNFQRFTPLDAGWADAQTLDKVAIGLNYSNTRTGYFEFDQVQILVHPLDQI